MNLYIKPYRGGMDFLRQIENTLCPLALLLGENENKVE
jgi:hypothetical protein